jgi:type II secretory pathway component PulM
MLLDDIGLLLQENSVLWGSVGGCVLAILAYAWRRKTPQSKHIKWIDHYLSDQDSSESSIEAEVQAINTALNSAEECNDPQQCSEQMRDIVAASHLKYQTLEEDSGIIMKCSRHTRTFHGAIYTRYEVFAKHMHML